MSRGLASLLTVIGAGASGYGRGLQIKRDNDRQDARDAQQQEEYAYQKGLRDDAAQLKNDVAASQRDVAPEVTANTGATYPDADLMASDNRENRRNMEQTGMPVPVPMTANPVTPEQQQAMLGVNSRASKMTRLADVYSQHGEAEKAIAFQQFAQKALDEGADKTLGAIAASAPSVDAVKKAGGTIVGKIGADTADIFNKTGSHWKVNADTPVQHFIDKDATGREFVNSRVMGKDGKEVVGDVVGMGRMLMTAKERMAADKDDARAYQTGQQITESGRHNKAEEGIQRTAAGTAAAHLGVAQAQLKLAQDRAFAETPAGQIKALETATGTPLTPEQKLAKLGLSKISEADKMAAASYMKELDAISAAENKGYADNTLAPDSAGAKQLATKKAALTMRLNATLGKYNTGAPGADPAGFNDRTPPVASKAPAAARGVAPPMAASSVQPTWRSPSEQAIAGLDAALAQTGQAMAQASAAGNTAEVQRLQDIFAQQNAAKQAAMGGQ